MAVLAGLGVEEKTRREDSRTRGVSRWRHALVLAAAAAPLMLLVGYWLMISKPPLNLAMFGIITPLAVALHSARLAERTARWLGITTVLLVALDLSVVDITLIEARSPEHIFEHGRASAEWLADQPGRFRVYSPGYSIPQHVAEHYGLELASGVDPLQLLPYADYLTRAAGLQPQPEYSVALPPLPEGNDVKTALEGACPNAEMLGQLGVRYAVAAFPIDCRQQTANPGWQLVDQFDGTYLYQNEDARPVPDTGSEISIALADGSDLFRYDPRPVYAGWALSGATLAGVISWAAARSRSRGADD
jgi:hypothetical protein